MKRSLEKVSERYRKGLSLSLSFSLSTVEASKVETWRELRVPLLGRSSRLRGSSKFRYVPFSRELEKPGREQRHLFSGNCFKPGATGC